MYSYSWNKHTGLSDRFRPCAATVNVCPISVTQHKGCLLCGVFLSMLVVNITKLIIWRVLHKVLHFYYRCIMYLQHAGGDPQPTIRHRPNIRPWLVQCLFSKQGTLTMCWCNWCIEPTHGQCAVFAVLWSVPAGESLSCMSWVVLESILSPRSWPLIPWHLWSLYSTLPISYKMGTV